MSEPLLLGGKLYLPVQDLGIQGEDGARWWIVQVPGGDERALMQLWAPLPPSGALDRLREIYLQRFQDADALDPSGCRFGFDEHRAWFVQPLVGPTLADLWPTWGVQRREAFQRFLQERLLHRRVPALLHPEALCPVKGGVRLARVLGAPPRTLAELWQALDGWPPGFEEGPGLWEVPPEDLDAHSRPIRGRVQELTYLKSLALGLQAPAPVERMVVLTGEEGLGHEALLEWYVACGETEGLWPQVLELQHEESAGAFLGRLLQGLVHGYEADFYARHPEVARALARRLQAFSFLRAGRKVDASAPVEPLELQAALTLMSFAHERHARLLGILALERASEELQKILVELFLGSSLPWVLTCTASGAGPRAFLGALRGHPAVAMVALNRLEDADQRLVLADLVGAEGWPESFVQHVLRASLGNPGLLARLLEAALLEGALWWQDGRWVLSRPDVPLPRLHEGLLDHILLGRLQRQGTPVVSVVRALALADQPLKLAVLGRVLGLSGDPLEDALRLAAAARLVHVQEDLVQLVEPRLRALAMEGMSPAETRRMAKALLKSLQEEATQPILSLTLQTLALGREAALEPWLAALPEDPPPPLEAERLVQQAIHLNPTLLQQARLWEFQADAWTQATRQGRVAEGTLVHRSPYEFAAEALGLALVALVEAPDDGSTWKDLVIRVLRKRAELHLKLRHVPEALQDLQMAAEALGDDVHHPERPRLRLILGQLHLFQGYPNKGIRALEEGLQMVAPEGPGGSRRDQAGLLLELGRAQGQRAQFQRAIGTLQAAQRLLEHDQDLARITEVGISLATLHMGMGQPDVAYAHMKDAFQTARLLEDLRLQAECHLSTGSFRSVEQSLGPALSHLDAAIHRFSSISDTYGFARARVWRARTLAALGDAVEAENQLLQALGLKLEHLSVQEQGDFAFLQGEISGFRGAWKDAQRLFQEAIALFERAGLVWRERLLRLRLIQAQACEALDRGTALVGGEAAWSSLEALKTPVEGSNSRWLELEWHRAHALLLSASPSPTESVVSEALGAWSEVQAAARELRFPAVVLEASARSAALLLERGERLGARSRIQDAYGAFQELWSRVPEAYGDCFLGRPDLHRFARAVEACGLRFVVPERTNPLADWTPTQVTLSLMNRPGLST